MKHSRMINAKGRESILTASKDKIEEFVDKVEVIDLRGVQDLAKIRDVISNL